MLNVDFDKMSVSDYVNCLYSETDENNMLCIPSWDESEGSEDTLYSCEMTWDKDSVLGIADMCSEHIGTIEKIAERLKESDDFSRIEDVLEPDLCDFWHKYLRRFEDNIDIGDFEEEGSIDGKVFFGEELTESEQQTYDAYCFDRQNQSKERLGDNNFSYDVLIRSMRYLELLLLGAPKLVTDNEKRNLTEALVMFSCCLGLTKIESIN